MAGGIASMFTSSPCSTDSSPIPAAYPSADAVSRPIRRRFATTGRVRSGCLTCKRRKKKCDDHRWSNGEGCQACTRLGLVCERLPLRTVTPQQQKRKRNDCGDSLKDESVSGYRGETDRASGSRSNTQSRRKSHVSNTDNAADASNADDTINTLDTFSPHDTSPPPPLLPLYSTARRVGDGDADGDADSDDVDNVNFVKTPSSGFMALFALNNASPERILLKYYVEHLAPLCSILQEGKNEFRNVLLPMAIDDSSLLYALFTYASVHVPSSGPVPSITPLMRLKFETQAARGLSEAIRLNIVSESSVACALICSTAEVVSGNTKRWLVHLQGAGHLLNQLGGPEHLRRTSDGLFLLRNFAYHDIMAAFSTSSRPMFQGLYWLDDSGSISADCLMGFAHGILGHISDMCYFMADTRDKDSTATDFAASVISQGEILAQTLRSQPLDICATPSGTEHELLVYHAEAYRFSALLHLYRFLSRFAGDDTSYALQKSECVQNIMRHVYRIPSNLACEVGLVFPLFMAGVACAEDDANITYIRSRLENIQTWTKFQHVARIREVLESLWASGESDWEALLRKLDWQISLA